MIKEIQSFPDRKDTKFYEFYGPLKFQIRQSRNVSNLSPKVKTRRSRTGSNLISKLRIRRSGVL